MRVREARKSTNTRKVIASEVQECEDKKKKDIKWMRGDGREVGHVQIASVPPEDRTGTANILFPDHRLTLITNKAFREMVTRKRGKETKR